MAILKMKKIELLIHKSAVTDVLDVVQKKGVTEFIYVKNERPEIQKKTEYDFEYICSRLDFSVGFLKKYEIVKSKLQRAIEGESENVTEAQIEKIIKTCDYNAIIDSVQSLQERLNTKNVKIKKLKEEMAILSPWASVEFSLNSHFTTKLTKTIFVKTTITQKKVNSQDVLLKAIKKMNLSYAFKNISEGCNSITFFKSDEERIFSLVKRTQNVIVDLPYYEGTPREECERITHAINKMEQSIVHDEKKIRNYVKYLPMLKVMSDYMMWQKEKNNMMYRGKESQSIVSYTGWCLEKEKENLEKAIKEKTLLYELNEIEPGKDEKHPVEIENSGVIKPFEVITRLYGLPGHKDVDPTPFLAGFFFVFFGFCMMDVVYGLFLFAVTSLVLYFYTVPHDIKIFLRLIRFGGISSIFFGVFFGGYMGIEMHKLPLFLQKIQKYDPLGDPLPIFYLALILGVVQVMSGIAIKIYSKKQQGRFVEGLLDGGPWLLFFMSAIVSGLNSAGKIPGSSDLYIWSLYASICLIIITHGRKEKNVFKIFLKGTIGLYEIVSYFSDILSYARLLALGLASSALAFAINLVAQIMNDMIPYVGWLFMIVIIIGGHIFSIVIGVLSSFIHSARLQFVEFFGKFLEGSGRQFMPFRRIERNVTIQKELNS